MAERFSAIADRLRGARRIEIVAALALAALLALLLLNHGGGGETGTPLELRVERILQRIEGAGRVSAMITVSAAAIRARGGRGSVLAGAGPAISFLLPNRPLPWGFVKRQLFTCCDFALLRSIVTTFSFRFSN